MILFYFGDNYISKDISQLIHLDVTSDLRKTSQEIFISLVGWEFYALAQATPTGIKSDLYIHLDVTLDLKKTSRKIFIA